MNASGRLNTCKSRGSRSVAIQMLATGKRVRNTYRTFLRAGNSPEKFGLIPHSILKRHLFSIKDLSLEDGCAAD
jgi:hypothetical protein